MARDYRAEITAAVQAKSLSDLSAIAHQLLGKVEHDDERRARAAAKKAAEREARKRLSATNGMSPNVAGQPATSGDVPDTVPPLKRTTTTTTHPAREAIADLGDVKLQTALDGVRVLVGEQWADVAEFLLRRPYRTWQGWCDAMLRDVGMSSQFTPDDLATCCRDDATLDKRIGSSGVLRTFLGYARRERLEASRSPPPHAARSNPATSRRGTRGTTAPAGVPAPTSDPDVAPKWQT